MARRKNHTSAYVEAMMIVRRPTLSPSMPMKGADTATLNVEASTYKAYACLVDVERPRQHRQSRLCGVQVQEGADSLQCDRPYRRIGFQRPPVQLQQNSQGRPKMSLNRALGIHGR